MYKRVEEGILIWSKLYKTTAGYHDLFVGIPAYFILCMAKKLLATY